ncbi:conserved hypothetical protein [Aspergillus terreus NIH2624]|uniref:Uncharacterized protein n=1 Tax=Aspergillus terreus (strain NIH 2624 / FGSC A1156) TaxID=341663 RepID=Q0CH95_ASPTN|nr:uncharacterized protein ATEG_06947 [Aspergillus terreus NIH2624]EAU32331.1 conserved hypothetical protein [Aspergillus terreus NIH2624]
MVQSEHLDAPDGSSLIWILDHCFRYPGSYEIPLRTMYSLNCNPTRQPPPSNRRPETAFSHHSSSSSKSSLASLHEPATNAADFRAMVTHHASRVRSQPCSLPPSFVTDFLRRCFTPQLEDVDFPLALTGLDYLKDLEIRRRKEVAAALERLQLERSDLEENSELSKTHPGVYAWIKYLDVQIRKALALYTQIYIGIRRWTLINEMLMEPFNKANCVAMLNTLFPPVTESTETPTPQLTPQILKSQRDGFFRYISAMGTNGRGILDKMMAQGGPEGEAYGGWVPVRDALDKYLRITNDIIDECMMVRSPASFEPSEDSQTRSHKGRKVDSGISFGSSEKLPAPSIHSSNSSESVLDKPLPPFPTKNLPAVPLKTGGSTLERLAREIRKLGDAGKVKGLKKMRSTSALNARSQNLPTHSPDHEPFFEGEEMKRSRLLWEAKSRKSSHSKQPSTEAFQG